jgi:hypothetical protein
MEVVEVVLKTKQIGVEGGATIEVVQERGDRRRWRWSRLCFEIEGEREIRFQLKEGLAGDRFQF